MSVQLKPGWLERQLNQVSENVQEWPVWMRREAGFEQQQEEQPMTTETGAGAAGARLLRIDRCGDCKHYSTKSGQPACMKAEKRLNPHAHLAYYEMPDWCPMPKAEQWQPISTAPRDGTVFWAINNHGDRTEAHHGFKCFSDQLPEAEAATGTVFASNAGWREVGRDWPAYPTHWMPLPEPPSEPSV